MIAHTISSRCVRTVRGISISQSRSTVLSIPGRSRFLTVSEQARHSKWISIFQKWIPEVTTSLIAKRNTVQNQPCWLRIPSKMPGTTKLSRTRTLTTTFTCSRVRHGNRSRYTTRSVPTLRVCTNRYGTTGTMPRNFVTRCAMPNS